MSPRLTPLSAVRPAPSSETGGGSAGSSARQRFTDPAWLTTRARNVLGEPVRLLALSGALAVLTILVLILLPRQAERAASTLRPDERSWTDTLPLHEANLARRVALAAAQREFDAVRDSALRQAMLHRAPRILQSPDDARRRDSLVRVSSELSRSLDRVHGAPLSASYRALAETESMRADPVARALLDTLVQVERQRESYGGEAGADPVYIALTDRANEIGRRLEAIASARLSGDRGIIAEMGQPEDQNRNPLLDLPAIDTTGAYSRLASAELQSRIARDSLDLARISNAEYARRLAAARRREMAAAPPLAVLAGGLVAGCVLGFLVAFAREAALPRIGGVREVEGIAGARVLVLVGTIRGEPELRRRRSDLDSRLTLVKPGARSYRMLYHHLSATGASVPIVTVTGPEPSVSGVVAVNLAVAAASEGRGTLLVDLDPVDAVASRSLLQPLEPGVTDVRAGRLTWPGAVSSMPVGRDRLLDVITAGRRNPAPVPEGEPGTPVLRGDLTRMASRYDLAVLSASLEEARKGDHGLIAVPDVLLCVRVGETTHQELRSVVADARGAGLRVAGIVLWAGRPPVPPPPVPGRRYHRWETPEATAAV